MRRRPARTRSSGLRSTMAHQQSLLLLSLEHLATAPSYRPKRQGRLIPHQPIVPQCSQRPMRRPRIPRTTPLALRSRPLGRKRAVQRQRSRTLGRKRAVRRHRSRTLGQKRIVRRQPSQTPGQSPTGVSLLSGRRHLHRASVRSPSALLLLLRKRSLHRSNPSTRSLRRERRKRRSNRKKSRSRTRSRRSNGSVPDWDLTWNSRVRRIAGRCQKVPEQGSWRSETRESTLR